MAIKSRVSEYIWGYRPVNYDGTKDPGPGHRFSSDPCDKRDLYDPMATQRYEIVARCCLSSLACCDDATFCAAFFTILQLRCGAFTQTIADLVCRLFWTRSSHLPPAVTFTQRNVFPWQQLGRSAPEQARDFPCASMSPEKQLPASTPGAELQGELRARGVVRGIRRGGS